MQEYILGNIFGITQVLIGHPFDTLKTIIQNSPTIKITYTVINPKNLYKGVSYPLLMNGIGTSFLFGNYDYFYNCTNSNILSGICTGVISAFALTPFDYKKIQMQINSKTNNDTNTYTNTNTHNNINSIIKKYYSGLSYTLFRETTSIPIYFYTYNYLYTNNHTNCFFAGGIAGINSWLFTYPFDTLKTRKQLYQSKSFSELIKMGSLFNGIRITLLRAFIVNSTSFYIYETIKNIDLISN